MKLRTGNQILPAAKLRAMLLMSGALLGVASAPALAQSAPEAVEAAADQQGPSVEAAAADEDAGRDVVVVTALKRETDLQDTPISLSVVGEEALGDRHVQSLLDFGDGSVPGLRISTFESR